MALSQRSKRFDSESICSTMRSRIDELKQIKAQKQQIYQEMTSKFGKSAKIQKVLLKILESSYHDKFDVAFTEKLIQKTLEKIPEPRIRIQKRLSSNPIPEIMASTSRSHKKKSQIFSKTSDSEVWSAIIAKDSEKFLKEEQERYERSLQNQRKMKLELDRQVKAKNIKMLEELEIDRFYDDQIVAHSKTAQNKQKIYENEVRNKALGQKKIIDEFLKINQEKKTNEILTHQENEKNLVKKIQEDLKTENLFRVSQKNKEKKYYCDLIRANEAKNKEKMEKIIRDKQNDVKFMNEYSKMLDQQEKDRLDHLKRIENNFQRNTIPGAYETLMSQFQKSSQEDFELYQHQLSIEKTEKKKQELEIFKKKSVQEDLKKTYLMQIDNKFKKLHQEKIEEQVLVNTWKEDKKEFEKFEAEKKTREKQLRILHADFLKTQSLSK